MGSQRSTGRAERLQNLCGESDAGSGSVPASAKALQTIRQLGESLEADIALLRQLAVSLERTHIALRELELDMASLASEVEAGAASPPAEFEDAQMRLYCLGQFRVYLRDHYVRLRHAGTGASVMKYLALHNPQSVQRDVLLEALWPDVAPSIANDRLKAAIYRLRQALATVDTGPSGCEYVIHEAGGYRLGPTLRVWTDVEAFERAYHAGEYWERAGRPDQAATCYLQAVEHYQGDLLPDDRFEEWTLMRREELRDAYLMALTRLSSHWLQAGDLARAIEGYKRILAGDPWREDAYRALMTCYAAAGQRGLALRWYELCVQVLRDQLNLEPEAETVRLYEQIRKGTV